MLSTVKEMALVNKNPSEPIHPQRTYSADELREMLREIEKLKSHALRLASGTYEALKFTPDIRKVFANHGITEKE